MIRRGNPTPLLLDAIYGLDLTTQAKSKAYGIQSDLFNFFVKKKIEFQFVNPILIGLM